MVQLRHRVEKMRDEACTLYDSSGSDIGACHTKQVAGIGEGGRETKRDTYLWPIEKTTPLLLNSLTAPITPLISGAAVTMRTPH